MESTLKKLEKIRNFNNFTLNIKFVLFLIVLYLAYTFFASHVIKSGIDGIKTGDYSKLSDSIRRNLTFLQ